ncbi:MAG: protein-glutamate O-methyltransferase CheR [Colwelliaceae bacterium]|nr:protein-glutamate O-methyltransferase CheR [Colwelliaceae bacterium]
MNSSNNLPSEEVFCLFQALIKKRLGIHLPVYKRVMLGHRLFKRLISTNMNNFSDYYRYINTPENAAELETALELITTNETFFFREEKHFEYLRNDILPSFSPNKELKIWSAACSTGEEPYSIAMLMKDCYPKAWSLSASDVNQTIVNQAKKAIYLDERTSLLPEEYRKENCLKGTDEFEGYLRITPELRNKVTFFQFNLLDDMKKLGTFDLIFLRNVMIYFDDNTKQNVIDKIFHLLNPGGHLFISHSETLHGIEHHLKLINPAIYQREN